MDVAEGTVNEREQLWEGQRRLQRMLPEALAEAGRVEARGGGPTAHSPLAQAAASYATVDNFRALVVHEGPRGGYHCDLVFKSVPPGVANAMGSPAAMPFPSKFEAEEYGKGLLALVIRLGRQVGDKIKAGPPSFWLHEFAIQIPADILAQGQAWLDANPGDMDRKVAERNLEWRLRELGLAEGCTDEQLTALRGDPVRRPALMGTITAAMLFGVFTWPLREHQAPQEGRSASIRLEPGETAAEGFQRMRQS